MKSRLLNTAALSRVPSGGGKPEPVTQLEDGELTHRWPQVLPGSAAMILTGHTTSLNSYEDASIDAYVFASRTRKTVWRDGYFGRYLPTAGNRGHLLYVRGGQVFAVPFDPVRLEVDGAPVPVLDDAAADPGSGSGKFDTSASGAFVYASGEVIRSWPISWLESAGAAKPLSRSLVCTTLRGSRPMGAAWRLRWTRERDRTSSRTTGRRIRCSV